MLAVKPVRRLLHKTFWKLAHYLADKPVPPNRPAWVQVQRGTLTGGWLFVDVRDGAQNEMVQGVFDDFFYDALVKSGFDFAGKTAWDIGAHIGYHSLQLAQLVGSEGHVIAFEPNPYNLQHVRKHLTRNPALADRIIVRSCAVSDIDGKVSFRFSPDLAKSSLGFLASSGPPSNLLAAKAYEGFLAEPVQANRIDTLIAEGLTEPDLIKIDVEGAEGAVLAGAESLLASHHAVLAIEIHSIKDMHAVQRILCKSGYQSEILDAPHATANRAFILAVPEAGA